jgi:hypothetical protein
MSPSRILNHGTVLAAATILSCVPANETILEDGRSAADDAVSQAQQQLDQISKTWDEQAENERAKFARRFVLPACGQPSARSDVRCGLVHKLYGGDEFRKEFASRHCASGATIGSDRACSDKLVNEFIRVIEQRYRVRFDELCKSGRCESFLQTELRALRASNRQATEDYSYRIQVINEAREAQAKHVLDELDAELSSISTWTQERLDEAESQRAGLRGLTKVMKTAAAGLSAYAQTLQSASLRAGAYGVGMPVCNSDYACGQGYLCLKEPNELQGVCDRRFDALGVPSFSPPRPDSLEPGQRQCFTVDDCAAGFNCVAGNCRP